MVSPLRDQVLSFLEAQHVLTVATADTDGPWAAAVFYASEGFSLYFLSDPASRHARSIGENPRVAVAISDWTGGWRAIRGVQLEGDAERVPEGPTRDRALIRFLAKFPAVATALTDTAGNPDLVRAFQTTAVYRIQPRRLFWVDNRQGLGRRAELPLDAPPSSGPGR
jgi:uncharacterized protein YhbP (UPF0306 family)